jgi:hypothetical protein
MMTPQFLATATFAMLGSLTVAAQTPTPSSRPQPPSTPMTGQSDQKADQKSITLTGCLKAWDASMDTSRGAGAPGTRDNAATSPKFVLSNAKHDQMTGGSAAVMPGDHTASAANSTQYGLAAGSGVDLSTHVNHQVRVTGMRQDMASPTSAPSAGVMPVSDITRDQQTRTGTDMAMPMFMVSSVTLVSTTCTK